ncbi:hypothetical protein H8356DRAFT_1357040 [Neocallimastix lanati (nom. inval.)]|nr:hypothetical protein H8356DRAFT_1357040 [Neocallimastix sp. JGI-2020a]
MKNIDCTYWLLINCKVMSYWHTSLHTARRCIPNVPTYISIDHEHQNGIINSSLVGVIIRDWKYYNYQGLCFNSKRSIRVGLIDLKQIFFNYYLDLVNSDKLVNCNILFVIKDNWEFELV